MTEKESSELVESWINGNRKLVCSSVIAGPKPAVRAAVIARELSKLSFSETDSFIRILCGFHV